MNMDYSEAFELLRQDAEKERKRKADKAVHDNLYNKGFRDGLAVLDKIRAEINTMPYVITLTKEVYVNRDEVISILDKYKAEIESQESEDI